MSDADMHPIVAQMMDRDAFSQWLGLEVVKSGPGACLCRMTVRLSLIHI